MSKSTVNIELTSSHKVASLMHHIKKVLVMILETHIYYIYNSTNIYY